MMHQVPLLWQLHKVHHSSERLDWLPPRVLILWKAYGTSQGTLNSPAAGGVTGRSAGRTICGIHS